MPKKLDPAVVRIVVKVTKPERDALARKCEDEVRTVGSWFRLQIRRAWKVHKAPKRRPPYQRNADDGVSRKIDLWARLTETERDQLEILSEDEGTSVSAWFRRRLEAELGLVAETPRRRRPSARA